MGDSVNSVWEEHKELKQHIMKMEHDAATPKMKGMEFFEPITSYTQKYAGMLESAQVLGVQTLQKYKVTQGELDQLRSEDENFNRDLSEYHQDLNKKEKKRSVREKEATERLGKGHNYFNQSPEMLRAALEEERQGALTTSNTRITGDEFALDPESGSMVMSVKDFLAIRNQLNRSANEYRDRENSVMERDWKEGNFYGATRLIMEDIRNHLDKAIQLLYQANGVDYTTGKRVGSIKRKQAQKQFALAMEEYRDHYKNRNEYAVRRIVNTFKNTPVFQKEMEKDNKLQLTARRVLAESKENSNYAYNHDGEGLIKFPLYDQLNISSKEQEEVISVRDLLRKNPENYQKHKKIVDSLYQEFLQYLQKLSQEEQENRVLEGMIKNSLALHQGFAADAHERFTRERGDLHAIMAWLDSCKMAMKFLLEGKQPDNLADHLFLLEHCGISTGVVEEVNAKIERARQLRDEGKTDGQIEDILYFEEKREQSIQKEEQLRADLEQKKAQIQKEGGNPEQNPQVLQMDKLLRVLGMKPYSLSNEGYQEHVADREVLFEHPEEADKVLEKQSLFVKTIHSPVFPEALYEKIGEDGEKKKLPRYNANGIQRDVFSNLSTIEHPGDCGLKAAIRYLDNGTIFLRMEESIVAREEYEKAEKDVEEMLQKGEIKEEEKQETLENRKKERYDTRFKEALQEEFFVQQREKERIEVYIRDKQLENLTAWPTMEELTAYRKLTRPLYEKCQGLSVRMNTLFLEKHFAGLSKKEQEDVMKYHAFQQGVMKMAVAVQEQYCKRAQGLPGEEIKGLREYIDAIAEKDLTSLRDREAAKAAKAAKESEGETVKDSSKETADSSAQ